jgi:hypothetical protein
MKFKNMKHPAKLSVKYQSNAKSFFAKLFLQKMLEKLTPGGTNWQLIIPMSHLLK